MVRFAASLHTLGQTVALHAPPHFDAELVRRLLAEHRELNARFASLVSQFGSDPAAIAGAIRDCAQQFVELRRTESMRLYPVIDRAIEGDEEAQRQFGQLRLLMLSSARRTLRRLEELAETLHFEGDANAAADRAAEALAEYWQRNRAQIYPLYELLVTSCRQVPEMNAS